MEGRATVSGDFCMYCANSGYIVAAPGQLAERCPACKAHGHLTQGNQAGKSTLARRRTVQGFMAAIEAEVWRMIDGALGPKVFLYARPGALPSIKITLEVQVSPEAMVVIDEAGA